MGQHVATGAGGVSNAFPIRPFSTEKLELQKYTQFLNVHFLDYEEGIPEL